MLHHAAKADASKRKGWEAPYLYVTQHTQRMERARTFVLTNLGAYTVSYSYLTLPVAYMVLSKCSAFGAKSLAYTASTQFVGPQCVCGFSAGEQVPSKSMLHSTVQLLPEGAEYLLRKQVPVQHT